MDPKLWTRLKQIVDLALDQDRRTWPDWLAEQCGDNVDLFLEASSLLAVSASADRFIESPALERLGLWHPSPGEG